MLTFVLLWGNQVWTEPSVNIVLFWANQVWTEYWWKHLFYFGPIMFGQSFGGSTCFILGQSGLDRVLVEALVLFWAIRFGQSIGGSTCFILGNQVWTEYW